MDGERKRRKNINIHQQFLTKFVIRCLISCASESMVSLASEQEETEQNSSLTSRQKQKKRWKMSKMRGPNLRRSKRRKMQPTTSQHPAAEEEESLLFTILCPESFLFYITTHGKQYFHVFHCLPACSVFCELFSVAQTAARPPSCLSIYLVPSSKKQTTYHLH